MDVRRPGTARTPPPMPMKPERVPNHHEHADTPIRIPPMSEANGVKVVGTGISLDCSGAHAEQGVSRTSAKDRSQQENRSKGGQHPDPAAEA